MEDKIQLSKDEIIMRFVTSKKYKKHGYTERLNRDRWCLFIGIVGLRRLVVLRGRVVEEYYDSEGVCVATYELAAGGPAFGLNIPAGQWHSLRALDPGTVILEMKDGPYEPISPADILSM